MNKTKLISSVLAGTMSVTMLAAPVLAANDAQAVIDVTRTGTINVHKLIENDGNNLPGYGLANPDEHRVPVNNIGFSYVKIADIENIRGIVISKDGDIDWDADNGEVSVGAYYVATPELDSLVSELGIVPDAVYIKDSVRAGGSSAAYPTIQYDYNDQKAANFLSTEQANVDSAESALDASRDSLREAQNDYYAAFYDQALAQGDENSAKAAWDAAKEAAEAAQSAFNAANTANDTAQSDLNTAQQALDSANADFGSALNTYNDKLGAYQTNDEATLKLLNEASQEFLNASNSLKQAQEAMQRAQNHKTDAQKAYDDAEAAFNAASMILREAQAANDRAQTGVSDTIDGTTNAVDYAQKQFDNAQAALNAASAANDAAQTELDTANSALEDAKSAFNAAQSALREATQNNADAYAAFKAALDAMNDAKNSLDEAQEARDSASDKATKAQEALADAQVKLEAANTAASTAETAYNNAVSGNSSATGSLATAEANLNSAKSDYASKLAAYNSAVDALDSAAASGGIIKAYNVNTLEAMMVQALATTSEDVINNWVKANKTTEGAAADGYTDDNGVVCFSGLPLGLYMIAETDISYHDGIAGAWNDKAEGGFINNDQMNTYNTKGGTYSITPIDAHDQGIIHEYQYGDMYRESINPEWPVLESLAAPFLVSVPTTNAVDTTAEDVAAGDQYGEAGTVWQYTIDVYPKNQSTAIYKRIVDPDESDNNETLRTSEDYQMGDLIEQIIWAEAPTLQPNYLDVENPLERNEHLGYVISDTMSEGLTFDKVTKVTIIPGAQIKGANDDAISYIYYDPEGNRCSAEEALANPGDPVNSALNTITKYYDAEGHEVTKEVFDSASELNIGTYYSRTLSYKKIIQRGTSYTIPQPTNINQFDIVMDGSADMGIELVAGADYKVVNTDDEEVRLTNFDGETQTAIQKGTHGFAVVLTPSGLAKMNARGTDSIVCVYFNSILNKSASIGQATPANMNFPSLMWVNSNTGIGVDGNIFRKINGNEVYDYTYELVLKKEGVKDATNVKFVISRDDPMDGGDINQVQEKDLTDSVSQGYGQEERPYDQDDSMRFVEEAPGIYHVWGYLPGENVDEGDSEDAFETTSVNGVTYNTLTPSSDGTLKIKGLDSNDYIFKEIKTEAGKNLLKDTFKVSLRAEDPMRDGRIKTATVSTGSSSPIGITIGAVGTEFNDMMPDGIKNLGIASMAVTNYNVVDLRTGGEGTTILYICGIALLAAMGTGIVVAGKKKKSQENA